MDQKVARERIGYMERIEIWGRQGHTTEFLEMMLLANTSNAMGYMLEGKRNTIVIV